MKYAPWIAAALVGFAGFATAQDSSSLSVDGEAMLTEAAAPAHCEVRPDPSALVHAHPARTDRMRIRTGSQA